jgi:hypothetical protein
MSDLPEYDAFADIYDEWVKCAPEAEEGLPFYLEQYARSSGPRVELGVGNGRIMIAAAEAGIEITGVDSAPSMLALTRQRAEDAGVADLLTLVEADFREFELPQSAQLVTIPFNTLGHLPQLEDKRFALRHIRSQMSSGAKLVFDMFVFDERLALGRYGIPRPWAEYRDQGSGLATLLWSVTHFDVPQQLMRMIVWTDAMDDTGKLVERRYRFSDFSWITPDQVSEILGQSGFHVDSVHGDFADGPLNSDSQNQVWTARAD